MARELHNGRISSGVLEENPAELCGVIEGYFMHSCNLRFGERLFHLGGDSQPLCCFGVQIPEKEMALLLQDVKEGTLVTWKAGQVTVYGRHIWQIHLGHFQPVDLQLPLVSGCSGRACKKLYSMLPKSLSLGIFWGEEVKRQVNSLVNAHFSKELYRAATYFVGRGKGLTPGGDDILTGFGLGRWMKGEWENFAEALEKLDTGRTTRVSAEYLRMLQKRYVNETMKKLWKALMDGQDELMQKEIRQIQEMGHTSGNDCLFGLSCGLADKEETGWAFR